MQGHQNHRQTLDRSTGGHRSKKQNFLQRCVMSTALKAQTDVAEKMALFTIKETPRYFSKIPPWAGAMT